MPPIEPGDYASLTLRRKTRPCDDARGRAGAVALRDRAARYEPVEGRGVDDGRFGRRSISTRTAREKPDEPLIVVPGEPLPDGKDADRPARRASRSRSAPPRTRPGSMRQLTGLMPARPRRSTSTTPPITRSRSWRGRPSRYDVHVKAIRKRVVPELDDEFAKDVGEFENLEALRTRVRADLEHEAMHEREREMRSESAASRSPHASPSTCPPRSSIARSTAASRSSCGG